MKRHLIIVLIPVIVVAVVLLCIPNRQPAPLTEQETVSRRTLKEQPQPKPADAPAVSKLPTPEVRLPQVTMTAVEYKVDPLALNRERENPPFELRGGAGTGRVIDAQGNLLLESSDEIAIFGATVGPNKDKVLVKGGDATNLVLEVWSGRKIKLPSFPPRINMLGFGDWHWIGPDLLLGTSGVKKFFHDGPHENCCNDNNVAQTKLYTFDLVTQQLSEVVIPDAITQPWVRVADAMSDGHIHLQLVEAPDGVDPNLGWFKIDASK